MKNIKNVVKKLTDSGIIRRVDELGRLVIPVNYREKGFESGKMCYLSRYEDYIILSKEDENNSKIQKTLDELGRVTINKEIREDLEWNEKDAICVWFYEGYVIMKKLEERCVFCKKKAKNTEYKGKIICENCKNELLQLWLIKKYN